MHTIVHISALPAATIGSLAHPHVSHTSDDCAALLLVWRRLEEGRNSSATAHTQKTRITVDGQKSDPNEPAQAQPRTSRRERAVSHTLQRGSLDFHAA